MKIIAISAGQETTKKGKNAIRNRIKYLNYGLLGLATILKHDCHRDVCMFQGDNLSAEELFDTIENAGIDIYNDCECFLLSIPSYYSISWCVEFCRIAKLKYKKQIVVGGRWVVDNRSAWIKMKLKYVDDVIEGFGEKKLTQKFGNKFIALDGSIKCFDWLDYRLLHNYQMYQPCVEISRGCGAGCQFCADKNHRRLPNKNILTLERELDFLDTIYDDYSVYFEAPHFVFERDWINNLCRALDSKHQMNCWRCTSRVETVPLDTLPTLSKSGLKVLDIGLESASKRQLINMGKTLNPDKYLEKAEQLLLKCKENDIWIKFNLLLYAGESYSTIEETTNWLKDHNSYIKDVSVSSLVYYDYMGSFDELSALGASIPSKKFFIENGYTNLDLSPEINYDVAKHFSVAIPKTIASQKDFFDIKKISYFENGYQYSDFLNDLKKCDINELPFYVDSAI